MGQPEGEYIEQSYQVYSNGTFTVSDNHGNSLSLSVLGTPSGSPSTTLVGNSSAVVEETKVTAGTLVLADLKLTFSVYYQSCQPAGVRLVISGTADWTPAESGLVRIVFGTNPISVAGDRAYFGNASGVALGFDWSDSSSLGPKFDPSNRTLSWSVGGSFSVDPETVGVSSYAGNWHAAETRLCYGSGRYWEFYVDNYNYVYATSADGLNWSPETNISTSTTAAPGGMGVACSGDQIYRAIIGSHNGWFYDNGTLGSNGVISWGTETKVVGGDSFEYYPSVAVDSLGNVWVAAYDSTAGKLKVWEGPTSWSDTLRISSSGCQDLVPLTAGKVALVYAAHCSWSGESARLYVRTFDGSSWSSYSGTSSSYSDAHYMATAVNDTVEVCAIETSTPMAVAYLSFPYGGSWSSPVTLSGTSSYNGCAIETDDTGRLVATWSDGSGSSSAIYFAESPDAGATWSNKTLLTGDPEVSQPVSGAPVAPNLVMVTWADSTGGVSDIRFAAFPPEVPTAASSNDPWSRPGLSPYESYFAQFSSFVSPGSGLLTVEQGLFDLPGRGIDLPVSLVYSQPYAFQGGTPAWYDNSSVADVGLGWAVNLPWIGSDYLHLGDGQAIPMLWSGSTFTYHGVTDFALQNGSAGYTLFLKDGTAWNFTFDGLPTSETDAFGNTITFSYSSGHLASANDTIGRTVTFSYDVAGQLSSISTGNRSWTLGYSGGDLAWLADPLGRNTTFAYNPANSWLISEIGFPAGGKEMYSYGNGVVWGTTTKAYYVTLLDTNSSQTHRSRSQNITYTVVDGSVVWSNSTMSGTLVEEHIDTNFASSTGVSKVYYEDGKGTLQQTVESYTDPYGRTNETKILSPSGTLLAHSETAYDGWGNTVYTRDNLGHESWFVYGGDTLAFPGSSGCSGSFYSQTWPAHIHDLLAGSCDLQDGNGSAQQESFYQYSGTTGSLLEAKTSHDGGRLYTSYTYDQYGNQLSVTNPDNITTYSQYSPTYEHAYLTKTWTPVGGQNVTKSYTYNLATGNELSMTNPDGFTTTYQYDSIGRTTQITAPAVDGVYAVTKYSYDDANNVLTTTGPDGHVTKAYFDGLARETEVQQMNGSSAYSATYYTYNWLDNVATKTTATNHTYTYSYDWDGRLTKLANPDGTYQTTSYNITANTKTVTDENGHPTVYHYDWNQRLMSVKEYNSSTTCYLTTYTYDLSGNMVSSKDANNQTTSYQYDDLNRLVNTTFPDGTYETKSYDAVGNLLTMTTPNGSTTSYSYDALNRLTQVSYPGSGGNVTYTYDAAGNRLSQFSPSVKDYYTYDAMNRLTNQTEYVSGARYTTLYAYDNASNVVQITYPDGYALPMTYDALNRLRTVGSFATLNYTLDGKISAIRYGNGEVQAYTYDSRDRPTQIKDTYGGTTMMLLAYTYDGTGNVLTENSNTYVYDWLNRLTSASGPWGNVTYTYDQVGNRVQMTNGSTTTLYSYAPFNRLASAGSVNYTYDANGNTVTKSGGWAYSYDYANRLASVSHNGAMVQSDSYDGDGNRVMQSAGNSSIVYSYQGVNVLYQKNLTSGVATKFFYAGALAVAQMVGSGVYYLHDDALGSVRMTTTPSATIAFSSDYTPYGDTYALVGVEALMYTGKLLDPTTGLYYEGARYYDPRTGRFVTEDSVVGRKADPATMNRYVYAADNPMRYVDPTGHMLMVAIGGGDSASTTTTCTTSPDVCASESGANAASLVTVSPGTSAKPPDVTLTQSGNDQYATSQTTDATITTPRSPPYVRGGTLPPSDQGPTCISGPCGAIAVGVVTGVATYLYIDSGAIGAVAAIPVLGPAIDWGVLRGDNGEITYFQTTYSPSWTPQGAAEAWISGFTLGVFQVLTLGR